MAEAVTAAAIWIGQQVGTAVGATLTAAGVSASTALPIASSLASAAYYVSEIALYAGMSYAIDAVTRPEIKPPGSELTMNIDPAYPREMVIGERQIGGSLVARYSRDVNNYFAHVVIQVADHPCVELSKIYDGGRLVQDTPLAHGVRTEITAYSNSGGPRLWMTWHDGRPGQTADTDLVTKSATDPEVVAGKIDAWTSDHKGAGCAYVHVEIRWDPDILTSIPQFTFLTKGARLYDRRKDSTAGGSGAHRLDDPSTWEYSTNAMVALDHFLLGYQVEDDPLAFGIGLSKVEVPYDQFALAADLCDEDVETGVGGAVETIKRYAANGVISAGDYFQEVIEAFQVQMAARVVDLGGRIGILGAEERAITVSLTEDDLVSGEPLQFADKLDFADLIGSVTGTFSDPANNYQPTPYDPLYTQYQALPDGGEAQAVTLTLPYEVHPRRADRLVSAYAARETLQPRLAAVFKPKAWTLEAGDWFEFTSPRLQVDAAKFEVVDIVKNDDFTVIITARAIDPNFLAFDNDNDPDLSVPPDIAPYERKLATPTFTPSASTISGGGAVEPIISITNGTLSDVAREIVYEVREWTGSAFTGPSIFFVAHADETVSLLRQGIKPGASYKIRMKVRAGARESDWSDWSSAITIGTTYTVPSAGSASAAAAGSALEAAIVAAGSSSDAAAAAAAASAATAATAAANAATAKTAAETAQAAAETALADSEAAALAAAASQTAAASAASGAAGSATAASGYASTASTAATNAATAQSAAATSATSAASANTAAQAAKTAAQTAETNAAAAQSAAATSASSAATQATNAAASALTASGAATAATGSATAAAGSATSASNSATTAGGSATAAAASATAAAASATAASGSASAASTSASAANTSATNAGTSASAAATSAVTAQSVANRILPDQAAILADFSNAGTGSGTPTTLTAATGGTIVTGVTNEGDVRQFTAISSIVNRGWLPVGSGRTFSITTRTAVTVDGTSNQLYLGFAAYAADGTYLGQVGFGSVDSSHVAADGWQQHTATTTSTAILAAFSTAAYVRGKVQGGRNSGGTTSGTTWQLSILRLQDTTSEAAAAGSASAAATSASSAATSASGASTSASAASTSATNASTSAGAASTSATNASNSATTAAGHAATASTQATNAANSATAAGGSATAAAGSASTASTQATNAGNSATAAAASAVAAASSATGAAGSASAASTSASTASTQATNAASSASAASISATNAATSAGSASTSATNASNSATTASGHAATASTQATNAANSATAAAGSATAASGSASTATTQATNAGNSATAAAASAVTAASQASNAAISASAASTSASTASTQASNAATSASAASTSATNAATSAGAASTSATSASTSATTAAGHAATASTQATNAANSATAAGGSATAAAGSASTASTQATNAGNSATAAAASQVAAASSATGAATSATAAATSASNASTSATAAGTSATAASTSATNAATSAGAASTSATNASNSATTASGHAATASTQATNAATSATAAAGSATAASGSASTASTQATNASNSATAAAASAVSAQSVANRIIPIRPAIKADFSPSNTSGTPDTISAFSDGTVVTGIANEGDVLEFTVARTVVNRGWLPVIAGHSYRSEHRTRVTVDGTANVLFGGFAVYAADGTRLGQVAYAADDSSHVVADGWQTFINTTDTTTILAAYATAAYVRGLVWGGRNSGATSSGATWQVVFLTLEDTTSEVAAAGSASAAATSASGAATSASGAATSASAANTSATNAATSASGAAASASSASTSATNASNSASTASTQAANAATSATAAAGSATAAGGSATSAATSASSASTSATNAGNSATAAAASAVTAASEAANALSSAGASASSASSASTSASAASTSASAASTSATNAATSAGAASTSATNASNSATTASGHAATASTQATNAANSATAAAGSATAASGSASTASTQATNAGNSATAAAASAVTAASQASNAASSASAASTSASTASTQASNAATSASAAATSATNASTSAGSASTSATNASNSATTASGHAATASTQAGNAATSATAAAGSATAASGSASTASTQATNAGNSATSAAASSVSAQSVANRLIPDRPAVAADFTNSATAGSPDAASPIATGTVATTSEGDVRQFTTRTFMYTRGVQAVVAGRTYRVESRQRVTVDGTSNRAVLGFHVLDSAYGNLGFLTTVPDAAFVQADNWETFTYEQTAAQILAAYSTAAYVRAITVTNDTAASTYSGATMQVATLAVRDITSEAAAGTAATAAATSASSAATSASGASTSATAASTSATNAATSAGAASTSATNASNSATTASGHAATASTQATNAANSATAAAGSATAASGSASSASTSATNAGNSATAAASSAVSAQSVANRLLPERPAIAADFSNSATGNGTPDTLAAASSGSLQTVANEGDVRQYTSAINVVTRGWLPVGSGKTFSLTSRTAVTVDGTSNALYQGFPVYAADGTYLGVVGLTAVDAAHVQADGWQQFTTTTTSATILAAFSTAAYVRGRVNGGRNSGGTTSGTTWQCGVVRLQDTTSEAAAASSASAAATSASNASTSASGAATSASAASTSATTASTQASNASTSASNASTSATNASSSASAASTSATAAATSASGASTSAGTATTQASAASASAAAASASASLSATYASAAGVAGLLPNPKFMTGVTGGIPNGWSNGANATGGTQQARPGASGAYIYRLAGAASTQNYIKADTLGATVGSVVASRRYFARATAILGAGTYNGAGLVVEWYNASNAVISTPTIAFAAQANTSGVVANNHAGLTSWEVPLVAPAGAVRAIVYACSHNSALSGGNTVANSIDWYEVDLVPETFTSASVTELKTAVTDSSGAYAYYGMKLDAGGRFVGWEAMASSKTGVSEFRITAASFKIYDGTTDVPMFEVASGVAYVAGSKVRTESMAANAVSSGVANETDAQQLFDQTWTAIASVSVTTPDANSLVYLPFSVYVTSVGFDATIAEARIKRGSTVIYQTDICGEPPTLDFETPVDGPVHYAPTFNGQVAGFDTDAPGAAGTYTYTLELRTNGTGSNAFRYWGATKRRLFALLFKR